LMFSRWTRTSFQHKAHHMTKWKKKLIWN